MLEVDEEQPDPASALDNQANNQDGAQIDGQTNDGILDNPELSSNVSEPSADADFEPAMELNEKNVLQLAKFLGQVCREENYLPIHQSGFRTIVEFADKHQGATISAGLKNKPA